MADTDTAPSPPAPAAPDANAVIQQYLQQILQGGSGAVSGPAAPATPAVNPNLPITSLLGEAFGGGVSPLYPMSEAQQTQAGNAALLNFGIGMLQNASGPVRHSLGQAVASGLLGAQGSLAGVREGQAQMLDVQNKQQQMRLEQLKTALPLLTLTQQMNLARGLPTALTGSSAATGTNLAATGAPIAPADSSGLNAAGDSATRKAAEGGPPAPNTPAAAVAQRTHDFWIGQGYTEPQVAGILAGGPGSESDFNPAVPGDNGTSYGLYQHHGERLANMQKYFGLPAGQMPNEQQQNQYAAYEISPKGPLASVGTQLQGAKTPAEAATIWTGGFGVPADKSEIARRANGANRFLGIYGPQPAQGGPATATATPTATTASTPPAQPAAAPGSGFGASAFNAPARTVMPAPPGGGATAPNTTAQLPPVPTPEMAAARVVAARTNKPAPIAGTDGLFVNPNGSVGPGLGGGGLGKRADVGAIVQGAQTAQTTMPPTSAVAAGPAAGGAVTPAAVTPPPSGAFGPGAFGGPTPAMIGTPPASQAPTQQPPAAIAKPDGHPDTSLNTGPRVPDQPPPYARPPLTPEQQAVFSQKLPADQQAMFEQRYQQARLQAQITGDQAPVTAVQADYAKASQEWAQKAQTALAAFDTDQGKQQNENWKTLWTAQNENDKAHRDVALDATKQLATSQISDNSKFMSANAAALQHGYDVRDMVSQAEPILTQLPTGGAPLLQNENIAPWLEKIPGLGDKTLQALQGAPLFQQAMARIAAALSPAELEGRQRPAMVNNFRDQLPTLSQTAEGRSLALAFVKQLAQRQIDTGNWINQNKGNPKYINERTGIPDNSLMLSDIEKPPVTNPDGTTSGGLGPMVRMPPPMKDPKNMTSEEQSAYGKYIQATPSGQPYFAATKDPTTGKMGWQYTVKPTGP